MVWTGSGCPDINGDGIVGGTETGAFLGIQADFNAGRPDWNRIADFNGDGVVNSADLGILQGLFGACITCPNWSGSSSSSSNVALEKPIYGSTNASNWLYDARDSIDNLDIIMVGDENNYVNGGGWVTGLSRGLITHLVPYYGSPILPSSIDSPVLGLNSHSMSNDWTDGLNTRSGDFVPPATPGQNRIGSDYYEDKPYVDYVYNAALLSCNKKTYFSAIPVQENSYFEFMSGYYLLDEMEGLAVNSNLQYMVSYLNGFGGSFKLNAYNYNNEESPYVPPTTINCSILPTSVRWEVATHQLLPAPRDAGIRFCYQGSSTDADSGIIGDVAFAWHNIFSPKAGASISTFYAGDAVSVARMRRDVLLSTGDGGRFEYSPFTTFAQQIVSRQDRSGGSGRLVVLVQGGTHLSGISLGSETASLINNLSIITNTFDTAWRNAGHSTDNITYAIMISQPKSANDAELLSLRFAAYDAIFGNNFNSPVPNLTFINLSAITSYEEIRTNGWNSSESPVLADTLSDIGYINIGERVIKALLDYADPRPSSSSSSSSSSTTPSSSSSSSSIVQKLTIF